MSIINANLADDLLKLADSLRNAERFGMEVDKPEGTRYVQMSDTLARRIVTDLVLAADTIRGLARILAGTSEPDDVLVVDGTTTIQTGALEP